MSDGSGSGLHEAAAAPVPGSTGQNARPEVAARLLGEALRQARKERNLALRDVAPVIRGSVSKLSRLERGESPPKDRDVRDLVAHYRLAGDRVHEIEALLQQAKDNAWWQQYSDVTPNWLKRLIGLEAGATRIYCYENHVVPGLLQTMEYTRALVTNGLPGAGPEEVERRVRLRLERQRIIRSPQRPDIIAMLDEGILLRPVGGPAVMSRQLDHLIQLSDQGRINIRVVPFDRSASAAPSYPITHLTFGDGGPSELVYVELIDSAMYLSRTAEIEQYRLVLLNLAKASARRKDSRAMLEQARDRYAAHAEEPV
ncbi:helix-turn-helix transcriptional regulator (plasmid) [Streptomyces sp. BB1-1-1]|uniref:helix-turn-helix domain-containing protein n=1 Tax=Streptomyces sp. BB1-1-1 TaxID=3074430 RepID=UPI0028772CA3|nr:helix-turn-helix transcriptional regulator [Streptomyces sp. BB1-1-1]WND32908.1 helix-turn-helix transcriptional regulator [Streptomyces sp. BB1-1-1]WND40023.1 helix-turn-helix transcriptional regulator [Streptomyces sp. BB1-1-1]WND40857.1 helix-turn-helix transcriptional regulator [Streptomyces sp. BB1-1-1]